MSFPPELHARFLRPRFVAEGLYSHVYAAETNDGQAVAVKIPKPKLFTELAAEMLFLEEADNLARLRGVEGCAELVAFGRAPHFVATRLAPGKTVSDALIEGEVREPVDAVVEALGGLVRALAEITARGCFQLDLHSGNILWDGARFTLIDLQRCFPLRGLARFHHAPAPTLYVPKRHPLHGVWWGLDFRNVHMLCAHLLTSLTHGVLAPRREALARSYLAGKSAAVSVRWLSRKMPARLARWVAERSFPEGVPFALRAQDVLDDLAQASGHRFARAVSTPLEEGPRTGMSWFIPERRERSQLEGVLTYELLRGLATMLRATPSPLRDTLRARLGAHLRPSASLSAIVPGLVPKLGLSDVAGPCTPEDLAETAKRVVDAALRVFGSACLSRESHTALHGRDLLLLRTLALSDQGVDETQPTSASTAYTKVAAAPTKVNR